MMRLLFCVGLVGAVAYIVWMPTAVEPEWDAGAEVATAQPELDSQAEQKLRSSWGPTLKSLGRNGEAAQQAYSQQFVAAQPAPQGAAYGPARLEEAPEAELIPSAGDAAPAEAPAPVVDDVAESVSWARVILGAKAHSEASVSSPITKFWAAGTELQIVDRHSGWLELRDRVTGERGWVFEKYLVAIDGPSPTQSVAKASPEPVPAKVAADKTKAPRQAAKPIRQARPVKQAANDVAVAPPDDAALSDSKRDRLTKKEERRERKLFRLFGRNPGPEAWTVGAQR